MQNGGAGQEAIELSSSAGLVLDDWQCYVIEESLKTRVDGKWACRDVCLICSRQNGKGSILEARELFGMFLGGEMELIHTAHQFKTAADHFKRIRSLIEGTPDLKRELKPRGIRESHGEESITLKSGARLRFVARSVNGSGRGFTKIDFLAVDEAYKAGSGALSALLPTQLASRNAQTWYTSSALDNGEDTAHLIRLRDRGRAGASQQLGYFEHSAPPDANPDDPYARAQGNPGLGTRLAFEDLQSLRESMSDEDFLIEHLSVWPDLLGAGTIISPADWDALEDAASTVVAVDAYGLEVSIDRATAAIGLAGHREDRLVHVQALDHGRGTGWVVNRFEEINPDRTIPIVVDGGGPANSLIDDLQAAGFVLIIAQTKDVGMAAAGIVDAVEQKALRHGPQPELAAAVAGAKKRPLGDGAFALGRKASTVDIADIQAVALAHWAATTQIVDVTNQIF